MGHTHEDIDQMFSRFSVALCDSNTETPKHLAERLHVAYTPNPTLWEIPFVLNFKSWIEPTLVDMHGHSRPHVYKVVNVGGNVRVFWKLWARRRTWRPPGGTQVIKTENAVTDLGAVMGNCSLLDRVELQGIEDAVPAYERLFLRAESVLEWDEWFSNQASMVVPQCSNLWATLLLTCSGSIVPAPEPMAVVHSSDEDDENTVYIGARPAIPPTRLDFELPVGSMVAVVTLARSFPFELGEVLKVNGQQVLIQWYGTRKKDCSGVWRKLNCRGTSDPYTDEVSLDSIIWGGFQLLARSSKISAGNLGVIRGRLAAATIGDVNV